MNTEASSDSGKKSRFFCPQQEPYPSPPQERFLVLDKKIVSE